MSCGCENKKLGSERERIRRLAKAWAMSEGETVVIFQNDDGSFGFTSLTNNINKSIIEYISPY